jgi:hypothetical protein
MTSDGWDVYRQMQGKTVRAVTETVCGRPQIEFTDGTAVTLLERFGASPSVHPQPVAPAPDSAAKPA